MKHKALLVILSVLSTLSLYSLSVNIRSFDHKNYTRVVLEGDHPFEYHYQPNKTTIDVRLEQKAAVEKEIEVFPHSALVDRVVHTYERDNSDNADVSVFRIHLKKEFEIDRSFALERPFRVVFDLKKSSTPHPPAPKAAPPAKSMETQEETPLPVETPPQEDEENEPAFTPQKKRTLINTICIDPGHGGADLGAVGRSSGMTEKVLTLKLANRLKQSIEKKLGLYVVMTREKDEEVSLNSRVSRANNQKAQLFVSIHINSSFRKSARGPETYYVSLKATDQEAFQLSQKENGSFKEDIDRLANDADDELKMILWNMAQTEYIKESSKLADFIQSELNILMDTANRGVKQAPFRVLMRAAMPAVLVEIAFISNYTEEKKLADNTFLERVANALYLGISKYIYYYNNLNR